jgi:hypothetical protein
MSGASKPTEPIEIFYAYSHKDEHLRDELEKHLSILKRQGVIIGWHDRKISPGREWEGEIDTHLNTARIILLLISPDFIASDYCWGVEVKRAMDRHEAGEARVIPIILRSVVWEGALFGKLQALPKDAKPVTSWANRDKAFVDIAQGIRAAVEEQVSTQVPEPQIGRMFDLNIRDWQDIGLTVSDLVRIDPHCREMKDTLLAIKRKLSSIPYSPGAKLEEFNEWKEATNLLTQFVSIKPTKERAKTLAILAKNQLADIFYRRGIVYLHSKDLSIAIALFRQSITLNPGHRKALARLKDAEIKKLHT